MPDRVKAMQKILHTTPSTVDELDRVPTNVRVSDLDIIAFYISIISHLVDVGIDINIVVRYYINGEISAFCWTLGFLLFPAFVNTAVSIRMYAQDKDYSESISKKMTKQKVLRIFVLIFQMAPILRYVDALRYALKSRRAEKEGDPTSQRRWYALMLKEDSDAALLRAFECFLEAAPQQVLQLALMIEGRGGEEFQIHQSLAVISSCVSMGWCLAAYQRAVRFAQEDKENISWPGSIMQLLWHFLVTVSRIVSIAMVAYLAPMWTVVACGIHALIMASWLQFYERTPFCTNAISSSLFSLVMGLVYIFTYIMPVDGRTRYRYTAYYLLCFIQDSVCMLLWVFCTGEHIRTSPFFIPLLVISIVPFILGILCMILYYQCLHPKLGYYSKRRQKTSNKEIVCATITTNGDNGISL